MNYLYGFHDPGGEHLMVQAGKPGWIVHTFSLSESSQGVDFTPWKNQGLRNLARINWGYGTTGTIPKPEQYNEYAERFRDFVLTSRNCDGFIVGNEPNHPQEWPDNQPISAKNYFDCYRRVYGLVRPIENTHIIPAAIAPWTDQVGQGWIEYFKEVLNRIGFVSLDGIAIHSYSRGYDPNSIFSEDKMGPPYAHLRNGFRTYQDFLNSVPIRMRHLPVYITEFNGNGPWVDQNSGYLINAYREINNWNHIEGTQKIFCLCLFRWPKFDTQWHIEGKQGVIKDFQTALSHSYKSPEILIPEPEEPTMPPTPVQDKILWDTRLTQRGASIQKVNVPVGGVYWKIISAQWLNENEARNAGPDHHILVDTLDKDRNRVKGVPVKVTWPSGEHITVSEAKPGERWSSNYPMSPSRNEFSVEIDTWASEKLIGIGMGADTPDGFNAGIHTSTEVIFQRVVHRGDTDTNAVVAEHGTGYTVTHLNVRSGPGITYPVLFTLPPNAIVTWDSRYTHWVKIRSVGQEDNWVHGNFISSQPVTQPDPVVGEGPTPIQTNIWKKCLAFVLKWEGGWADDPNDPGGATMKGITLGTYTRWRESHGLSQPTKEDLRNIPDSVVEEIYFEWYWKASGADKMSWPLCLAHFDLAVNGGVGRAKEALQAAGPNFMPYMLWRMDWYTRIENFEHFGRAWIRRSVDLIRETLK